MPQVQVIQPIQQQPKRLRVAAYARVSSDSEDQLNSLAVQVDYYTHLIQENPNWEFAGIYTDEGITGTSTKRREQFNRLMDDCRAGLIDRVLVKSASRFARNTADALSSVRELKSLGVTVAFEKEGFDTETSNGEMLLSIICAVAQEESLSILANEIYCGAKGYPAIISKEVYSQAASIRSNKTVTYSAVLKPFRSDMQCACCGERLYWRPRTQQWTCRQCGMWSKPMQPENMAQQIVDRLYQIQQHPEIIHNPKEQCNTRSIEVAQLDHEIHTALALPELDADAIIDKILRRAELQFNYCAAGDDDPTTMQIKRACKEFKPTDTFPESFYSSIVSKIILHLDTHIDIKLRNGQTL